MKSIFAKGLALAAILSSAAVSANDHVAILVSDSNPDNLDFQEYAAYRLFKEIHPDGKVIAAGQTELIDANALECIWVHIDRCNIGKGNLPAEFTATETINALAQFVNDGSNLYLSKQATQLLPLIGRIDAKFAPGIYGDGDGGLGTDVWTVQAQIGFDNIENDPSQYYDRRNHPIYMDMVSEILNDYSHESFGLLGTGNGTEMHREDHNCMWDLNAYTYTAEGRNTVEKFENENNAVVLGQWGHVKDYAVAGIVEFKGSATTRSAGSTGTIIANGLAAYELSPRNGVNAYAHNISKLTENTLAYLAPGVESGVENVESAENAAPEYYTLQGVRVNSADLAAGIYVVRRGTEVKKVIIK